MNSNDMNKVKECAKLRMVHHCAPKALVLISNFGFKVMLSNSYCKLLTIAYCAISLLHLHTICAMLKYGTNVFEHTTTIELRYVKFNPALTDPLSAKFHK